MAASKIDPFAKKPTAAELKARVTGATKREQVPLTPGLPPGVRGNIPLPTGRVVSPTINPDGLTEIERSTLEATGWTPDVPIPNGMADILNEIVQYHQTAEVELPVDPTRPPLKVETKPLSSLPSGKQAELIAKMKEMTVSEANAREQEAEYQRQAAREMAVPGAGQAMRAAAQASAAKDAALEIEHEADERTPSPTGANYRPTHCPHCDFDLSNVEGIEPPTAADKSSFVQTMLGQKPFTKEYNLFGGNLIVAFRTLTTREVEVVYQQAYLDRKSEKAVEEVDYFEMLNRYRFILQIASVRAAEAGGMVHNLHEGYSQATNPSAATHWVSPEQAAEFEEGQTGLPTIEQWVLDEVLSTEPLFRAVNNACNQFNRLVIKMEALADNSDFWRPTGAPS